jgi:hypothetical protein
VSRGSLFLHVFPPGNLEHVKVETNLIADDVVYEGSFDGRGKSKSYRNGDPAVAAEFAKRGNILVQGDPGFGDLRTQDFRFSPHSPAAKFSFEPIPFEQMGLVRDEYRKSLPIAVDAPTIIPGSATFTNALTVRLLPTPSPHRRQCVIRYTLDGSDPTPQSPTYLRPLEIATTVTLKAAAFVPGKPQDRQSETGSATFTAR